MDVYGRSLLYCIERSLYRSTLAEHVDGVSGNSDYGDSTNKMNASNIANK